jgi:hypothetical protein
MGSKVYVQDELSERIVTDAKVESEPARLVVAWVHWDSGFRAPRRRGGRARAAGRRSR